MSHWPIAMKPAISAVAEPIKVTSADDSGAAWKNTLLRTIRNMPAVTIVAAWISALTGVGPAIASGSQTNSGICALLPVTPSSMNSVIRVITLVIGSVTGPKWTTRLLSFNHSSANPNTPFWVAAGVVLAA